MALSPCSLYSYSMFGVWHGRRRCEVKRGKLITVLCKYAGMMNTDNTDETDLSIWHLEHSQWNQFVRRGLQHPWQLPDLNVAFSSPGHLSEQSELPSLLQSSRVQVDPTTRVKTRWEQALRWSLKYRGTLLVGEKLFCIINQNLLHWRRAHNDSDYWEYFVITEPGV